MTKNEALEAIQGRIENLIEKEIDKTQPERCQGWDEGYNAACEQILKMIKFYKNNY